MMTTYTTTAPISTSNTIMVTNEVQNSETQSAETTVTTKKFFDKEYATQYRKEVAYLRDHGFYPCFIKTSSAGVTTYKFKRSSKLFATIAAFYDNLEKDQAFIKTQEFITHSPAVDPVVNIE